MAGLLRTLKLRLHWLIRTPLHPQWLLGSRAPLARWISARAFGQVLDIGCADRWVAPHLAPGCDYLALDYPPTGRLYAARPHLHASAAALPLIDRSADTVLLIEVAEHLAEPARAFAEIARVLRPGGRMLFTVPFLYPVHDAPHDYQRWTSHGLRFALARAGLEVDSIVPTHHSAESAALLLNLALVGQLLEALRRRHPGALLLPFALLLVPLVNFGGWICSRLLPSWDAQTTGYRIEARRSPQRTVGAGE